METSEGYGVIRGHFDLLYDPKGHDDLCDWFDSLWPLEVMGSLKVNLTY